MHNDLDLGPSPPDLATDQAVLAAAQRVARRSPNLVLLYLDQIEQLLYSSRSTDQSEAFFACLGRVVELPLRNLRVLVSLREDYLGRFRDRLQGLRSRLRLCYRCRFRFRFRSRSRFRFRFRSRSHEAGGESEAERVPVDRAPAGQRPPDAATVLGTVTVTVTE